MADIPVFVVRKHHRLVEIGTTSTRRLLPGDTLDQFFESVHDQLIKKTTPAEFVEYELPRGLVDRFYTWLLKTHGQKRCDYVRSFNLLKEHTANHF